MNTAIDAKRVYRLENEIMPYAWGSTTAIPGLLGRSNPEGAPQAELWMGAHPKAPSMVVAGDRRVPLDRIIAENPKPMLGASVLRRFGDRLPFLFKVLSASKALSIQAHPNLRQAREGFRRETEEGVPIDSPVRNYRDDNHKPEILCALGEFWGMKGFRTVRESAANIRRIGIPALEPLERLLAREREPESVLLRGFIEGLLSLGREEAQRLAEEAADRSAAIDEEQFRWVVRLASQYPGDVGVLAPLFLNVVRLEPGEAVFQKAGELHAYLEGTGIELMANSDNVLRGGLTPKHIDVEELVSVLAFEASESGIIHSAESEGWGSYETPIEEFRLSRLSSSHLHQYPSGAMRSIEILLCVGGAGEVSWTGPAAGRMELHKGESVLVPAEVSSYTLSGELDLFRADVPPARSGG